MKTTINHTYALFFTAIFFFTSCASIVSQSKWPVTINSNPSGAKITITNKKGEPVYAGSTPATVSLKSGSGYFSKAEYQLTYSLSGYDDKTVPIEFKFNGWYIGNLAFGALIGLLIVDPLTGAMWRIDTEFINETLTSSTSSIEPRLQILNVNSIPEEWKAHLIAM